jgi:DNA-binding NarL/FixJ family response regulator
VVDYGAILIVDADAGFRAFVSGLFRDAGYNVIDTGRGDEALASARKSQPGLVVLDVGLPDISGFEVCQQLRDEFGEDVPIIFVSGDKTAPVERAAGFLVGGDDYLVKPVHRDELLARARRLIHRSRTQRPLRSRVNGSLTQREIEVLTLLADGRRSDEVAQALTISPKTVATHVQRILAKLGARTRAEAIAVAYKEGLTTSGALPTSTDVEAHVSGNVSKLTDWFDTTKQLGDVEELDQVGRA